MPRKPFATRPAKPALRKKVAYCAICSKEVATKEVLFRLEGATVVQKFCDRCFKDAKYEI
jgi:hypothetical protein